MAGFYGFLLVVHLYIQPSNQAEECILVCLKIMDTSVYFNEVYSEDTQTDWFV